MLRLPMSFTRPHTILAAKNKKHVIVEKPMALSIADCEEMNNTAEKYGVKLLCSHTHSFDPAIRKMREIIVSGQLGEVCMINSWNYNDFMVAAVYKPRSRLSDGVVLNQGPHQVDIVRLLAGGKVRSVRARTGKWDKLRAEGAYVCFLEFENGTPATLVYNGYGFFDTSELFWWIGEGGYQRHPNTNAHARQNYKAVQGPDFEKNLEKFKETLRHGGRNEDGSPPSHGWPGLDDEAQPRNHQKFFGLTLVTCEKGDIRQSPDGIYHSAMKRPKCPLARPLSAVRPKCWNYMKPSSTGGRCFMTAAGAKRH